VRRAGLAQRKRKNLKNGVDGFHHAAGDGDEDGGLKQTRPVQRPLNIRLVMTIRVRSTLALASMRLL
jgi:hypothetical protein